MTSSSAAKPRHMALVGMMGSGKSIVARRAALELDRPFVDLDDAIEAAAGASIPDIFAARGESGFRELETHQLVAALARPEAIVLATGGGVLLREANRNALAGAAAVVWLRATPQTLAARVGEGRGRPLLDGADVAAELGRLTLERQDLYAAAADVVIDVDELSIEQVTTVLVVGVAEAVG